MRHQYVLTLLLSAAAIPSLHAQYIPPDPSGLEGIIVEPYYVADSADAADLDGSSQLVPGAITYRVFVDLKQGYTLLTVGGFPPVNGSGDHPISFSTSTSFFNNDDRGEAWGSSIGHTHLDENTVALDSWLSMGAASDQHWGVLKSDDPDGSIVGGANNDGGSNAVPGGLLVNENPLSAIPLTTADGLWNNGTAPDPVNSVGTPPAMFDAGSGNSYSDDNFAWAVLTPGGVAGPDTNNRILIGQFTTDGEFQFCLNLWVRIPDSLVCNDPNCLQILEYYADLQPADTAGSAFITDYRFTHPTLCFDSGQTPIDCQGVPGGPAQPGTACDDGDPDTENDTWDANCICSGLPVGIAEVGEGRVEVTARPNPAHDLLWAEITTDHAARAHLELRDAVGSTIIDRDLGRIAGRHSETIDMSGLNSGIYFLNITVDGRPHVERITHF
ncbi:MAG: T9SS type A sorting domain-containing protein [Flavobacteriales bacterium]|nr:T9SS type A sorting domain-containing protein [Flavobacteriales bacterium]MCB9192944.1 T9SS type A sorting domain-containing protein [Flavobacteriales bacterium]